MCWISVVIAAGVASAVVKSMTKSRRQRCRRDVPTTCPLTLTVPADTVTVAIRQDRKLVLRIAEASTWTVSEPPLKFGESASLMMPAGAITVVESFSV